MKWRPSLASCLLLLAVVVRVAFLGEVPASIESEEASLGYAAWSWLHHGPASAFFLDPLSGRPANPLYVLLSLPFVAALDVSLASTRLPSAIAGIAALWMLARLAGREDSRWRNVALLVAVTSPWHLMASRWASGAHVAPAFVLAAVLILEGGRASGVRLVAATLALSVSALASGPSAMFAVVFSVWIFLAARRAGASLGALAGSFAVSPLMVLGAFVLADGGPKGPFPSRAFFQVAELLPATPAGLSRIPENAGKVVSILLGASVDGTTFGATGWGPVLVVLIPFLLWGILVAVNDANRTDRAMLAWLALALATACCYRADVRNMSPIFVPALWLAARGLWSLAVRESASLVVSGVLRGLVVFGGAWFTLVYFAETGGKNYAGAWVGFGDALQRAIAVAPKDAPIIVTTHTPAAHVPTLFYATVPPQRFPSGVNIAMISAPPLPSTPGVTSSRLDVAGFDRFLFGSGPGEFGRAMGRLPHWVAERSEWPQFDALLFAVETFGRYAVVGVRSQDRQACTAPIDAPRLQGTQELGVLTADGIVGAPGAGFTVGGQRYTTGLGVIGQSSYILGASGEYELSFGVAMPDTPPCGDGMSFEVQVDGRSVFASSRYRPGDVEFRLIPVSPRRSLTFMTHAGMNVHCDHGAWLRPTLVGCQSL